MSNELKLARIFSLLVAIAIVVFGKGVAHVVSSQLFHLDELYNAVFNMAAVIGGFVFAIYGILVSSEGEFVKGLRVGKSTVYGKIKALFLETIVVAFIVVFYTLPFIAFGKKVSSDFSWSLIFFGVWGALVVHLALCFFLTIIVFAVVEKTEQ